MSWLPDLSQSGEWKRIITGSSVCNLIHKRNTITPDLSKKGTKMWCTRRSPHSETTKSSLAQIAKCNLTFLSIRTGSQDSLSHQIRHQPADYDWTGKDRTGQGAAASCFLPFFRPESSESEPRGWMESLVFTPGWSGWDFIEIPLRRQVD